MSVDEDNDNNDDDIDNIENDTDDDKNEDDDNVVVWRFYYFWMFQNDCQESCLTGSDNKILLTIMVVYYHWKCSSL